MTPPAAHRTLAFGIDTPADVTPEVETALEQFGLQARRLVLVSPPERKNRRCAYRLQTDDGRTLKLRQLETAERARHLVELRTGLEEAFVPALACSGRVLLEEWIDGSQLTKLDAEARVEDAGALLGRLHAQALGPDAPATLRTRTWVEQAMSDLKMLADAHKLAPHEVAALRADILQRDPGTARACLIHMDFCAENMLIGTGGQLLVIDNELLTIGPPGLDLGRTFDRWPMSAATWGRFRHGYRSSAAAAVEAIGFWKILAALMGARVRLKYTPERLDAVLALLRRFSEGEGLSEPS